MLRHVLVVDDSELTSELFYECLRASGIKVSLAFDAENAIEILSNNGGDVNLVITDLCMPREGDGVRLLEWISSWNPNIPVVLMSGYEFEPGHAMYQKGFAE